MNLWLDPIKTLLEPWPWAWTAAVTMVLLLIAWLANWITKRVLLRGLHKLLEATVFRDADTHVDVKKAIIPRLANVVPAVVIYAGVQMIPDLPATFVTIAAALCQAFVALTVALSLARAANLANTLYEARPDAYKKPIKGYLQVLKIAVFVFAGIWIVATLVGAKFTHVLTGMGAMTAVTMLIFQDTIVSFVASVQISGDGRVRVGDWIEMPGQNADGDVIDIALHTITVQNWDKTVTTIPTKKLINESFKNWRGMSESGGRRIKRSLYIDQKSVRFLDEADVERLEEFILLDEYLDHKRQELSKWNQNLSEKGATERNYRRVTNLGTFRMYVNQYLLNHPGIHKDMTLLVRQLQPGQTGIPLEIYCFTNDTRWAEYEKIQSDIFDHLLAILPEFGLQVYQAISDSTVRVQLGNGERAQVLAH